MKSIYEEIYLINEEYNTNFSLITKMKSTFTKNYYYILTLNDKEILKLESKNTTETELFNEVKKCINEYLNKK